MLTTEASFLPFVPDVSHLLCSVHAHKTVQVEHARGILRRLTGDLGENRELAVFSLEKAIQDYEASKPPLK